MYHYVVPSRITFGEGAAQRTGQIAQAIAAKTIFCVYDPGVKAAGLVDQILDPLKAQGFALVEFGDVLANPPDISVYTALDIARQANVDAVLAIGGGSAMDTAKAVNILLTNAGRLEDYEGPDRVTNRGKPLIAIPTTAGTSSEITHVTVITNERETRKMVIVGQNVGPDYALIDPQLTIGLPPAITAATGMDAVTHAIESYLSINASPLTEYSSLKAIEIFRENLPKAYQNGNDLNARTNVMLGCVIVGFAFNNADLGMVHAIAHTLSSHFGVAHGVANATLLPHVMEFNAATSKNKLVNIAKALGVDTRNLSEDQASSAAIDEVKSLCAALQIPALRDLGVKRESFDQLAEETLKEGALMFNPRQPVKTDVIAILEKAF
ncbi:MAG: alcohol dehydrogenase [Shinella sp.]|nr:MAG: alcohol dehydrogenase [Shinella sp.]